MKKGIIKSGLIGVAAATVLIGCKGGSGGFQTDSATGVQYHFFKHDENGKKPQMGDYARLVMVYRNEKDSVIFDSRKRGGDSAGAIKIPLNKTFDGCLEQGVAMMAAGDSAEFKLSADSLWLRTFHAKKLPPSVHSGAIYTFDIKLLSFQNKQEMMQAQQQEMMKQQIEAEKHKVAEGPAINDYLTSHHLNIKPTPDSIFYLQRIHGKGKPVMDGDSLEVKYKGMLLDGSVFDQSDKGPGHTTISFVYSKNMHMIKGWVIALGDMREGEKAEILLPSMLAYGPQSPSPMIPAYSPLIFDLEVVRVKANK